MTPAELSRTVLHAVRRAVEAGELPGVSVPGRAVVAPPGPGGRGDYATTIALQLAGAAGQPPRRVAAVLRAYLVEADGVTDVAITGPGFLNLTLGSAAPAALVAEILRRGPRYGHAPTAPGAADLDAPGAPVPDAPAPLVLTCAHEPRAVVVAQAAARILRSQGTPARTRCAAEPHPAWTAALGARVDAVGGGGSGETAARIRPVPAPGGVLRLGRDAGRWALLHPAPHDRPRAGEGHLVQRESNPLFRVRYAHARSRALLRNAADLGFAPDAAADPGTAAGAAPHAAPATAPAAVTADARPGTTGIPGTPAGPADAPAPRALLSALAAHPRVLAAAAEHRAPDRLARHLVVTADAALPFLSTVLPCGAEKPSAAHRARLALAVAAGTVLAGGLTLLGIDAPDHL
ncbi:ArgS-related anticodon-binding protein NrtL [Streptomyces sp. SHP 1-2]|uniref:ArgS-related anticodon-binding protein NrtL n=1 Tax=Streptomyces sp. SHP 1-2 TaxID=2769489 RepID=UPI0022384A4C|nr:DALR anticodon-binding domain-containing protein [Streptomyces sp. SHP 1-2]MCW5250603.1 hypothetical protein [Streptomyces sp. SHP 1-2]